MQRHKASLRAMAAAEIMPNYDINQMVLSGRIVGDVQEFMTADKKMIVHLLLASNIGVKTGYTLLLQCRFYGSIAESIWKKGIKKNDRLTTSGFLARTKFVNNVTGRTEIRHYLNVTRWRFDYPPPSTFTNNYRRVSIPKDELKRFKAMEAHLGPGWIDPSVVEGLGLGDESLE